MRTNLPERTNHNTVATLRGVAAGLVMLVGAGLWLLPLEWNVGIFPIRVVGIALIVLGYLEARRHHRAFWKSLWATVRTVMGVLVGLALAAAVVVVVGYFLFFDHSRVTSDECYERGGTVTEVDGEQVCLNPDSAP